VKPIPQKKINRFFTKAYEKYYNTISLNKNLLISGSAGFLSLSFGGILFVIKRPIHILTIFNFVNFLTTEEKNNLNSNNGLNG
jgi:hypothetical protein